MDDFAFPFIGVLILAGVVVALFADPSPRLFARQAAVRERIRHEVHQEYDAAIQQGTGVRRWWLILKREREISRRGGRVIHGYNAA